VFIFQAIQLFQVGPVAVQGSFGVTYSDLTTTAIVTGLVDAHAGSAFDQTPSANLGSIDVGGGDIDITAIGNLFAKPNITSAGISGLASLSLAELNATVDGAVRAYVGQGIEVDAGSLDVLADASEMKAEALGLALAFAGLFAGSSGP
jgi:hypothetical protein